MEKPLSLALGFKYLLTFFFFFFAKLDCVILGDLFFLICNFHLQKGLASYCELAGVS